ncbi:GTP cyclohydrolase I FolE [Leucobacter sp. GX24907]
MSGSVDRARVASAVRELLLAIGADPDEAELAATPARVADAYAEFFSGMGVDPVQHLADALPVGDETGELVLLRDIDLRSVCEHHLLPFRGRAHIAYRPAERVVGLSALPRVVDTLASRPQVQERLGEQIADALEEGLRPAGVLVVLEASHGCVSYRGIRQADATTVTVASRGELGEAASRAEIMTLIGGPR